MLSKRQVVVLFAGIMVLGASASSDAALNQEIAEPALAGEVSEATTLFRQGSWRAPVKVTDSDPENMFGCDHTTQDWAADDPVATVAALAATRQNYYASHLSLSSEDCSWAALASIADEVALLGSDIKLVGALAEVTLVDPDDGSEILSPEDAASEYANAVLILRDTAKAHAGIAGLLIDDFHNMLQNPVRSDENNDMYLSRADVKTIYNTAHTSSADAPEIDFTPYFGAQDVPIYLMPAHILGVRGWTGGDDEDDHKLYTRDTISMKRSFRLDRGPGASGRYRLSFLYYDYYEEGELSDTYSDVLEPLELVVRVPGMVGLDSALPRRTSLHNTSDDPSQNYIRLFEAELSEFEGAPVPHPYSVSISVEANGRNVPKSGHKIVVIWDMKLESLSPDGSSSREVTLRPATYITRRPRALGSTAHMVAGSNLAFRIDHLVDGALVKYTRFAGEVDLSAYERFLESAAGPLRARGGTFESVFWGNEQWVDGLEDGLDLRLEMYALSQRLTDGIVVYRLENALHLPSGGVFTERSPKHPDEFSQMAFFPSQTSGTPGWRQYWSFEVTTTGEFRLEWRDNREPPDDSDAPLTRRMEKSVIGVDGDDGEAPLWSDYVVVDATDGWALFPVQDDITTLIVEMAERVSIGNLAFWMQFNLYDPSGAVLTPTEFWSDVDMTTQEIYIATVEFFRSTYSPE